MKLTSQVVEWWFISQGASSSKVWLDTACDDSTQWPDIKGATNLGSTTGGRFAHRYTRVLTHPHVGTTALPSKHYKSGPIMIFLVCQLKWTGLKYDDYESVPSVQLNASY